MAGVDVSEKLIRRIEVRPKHRDVVRATCAVAQELVESGGGQFVVSGRFSPAAGSGLDPDEALQHPAWNSRTGGGTQHEGASPVRPGEDVMEIAAGSRRRNMVRGHVKFGNRVRTS